MNNLTLKQAIGQLFMVGLPGITVDEPFADLIERWQIGNVVLFARNLTNGTQATALTQSLQNLIASHTGYPALISADQEGGIVLRLVRGATPFPGNMAIGATQNAEYARQVAFAIGTELRNLGINMNLAPVLDINNNPQNPVIGVRSFGTSAEQVARFARASVTGYRESGILCVAKHFPGHGDTVVDSHTGLPVIERSLAELRSRELVPFDVGIRAGLDAVMTAHILFPRLDDVPATLSRVIMTDVLRQQLGFAGLIVTDSMRMAGVSGQYGPGKAAVMALQAGCDILLYSAMGQVEEEAIAAVYAAVHNGELTEERIHASVRRVLAAKERLGQGATADLEENAKLALQVSRDAITLVRDDAALLPLTSERMTVIEVTRRAITQVEEQLTGAGIRAHLGQFFPEAVHLAVAVNPEEQAINTLISQVSGERVVVVSQDAWRNPGQQQLLHALAARFPGRVILVAGRLPYDVDLVPEIPTALCTYDLVTSSILALLEVLAGRIQARGVLARGAS